MEKTGKSYVSIQDWMYATLRINNKPLSLVELNIYALIHGFCMNGDTVYYGHADYVENLLGIPRTTYYRTLNHLVDSGLIVRQKISYDTVPRTVFYTAASRSSVSPTNSSVPTTTPSTLPTSATPSATISQDTQAITSSMPVTENNTVQAQDTSTEQSHNGTPTPNMGLNTKSTDSHSGTPTLTVGLSDSHSGTADSHSGTDTVDNKETTKNDNNIYKQTEIHKSSECMSDTAVAVVSDEAKTKIESLSKAQDLSLANSISEIWSNSPPSHSPINRVWFVNTDFPLGMNAINLLRRQGETITDGDIISACKNFISICANPASSWKTRYMKFSTFATEHIGVFLPKYFTPNSFMPPPQTADEHTPCKNVTMAKQAVSSPSIASNKFSNRDAQNEFIRLWDSTKDNKGSCIFSFTSGFDNYNAWLRLWAERPWSFDEMHRAFQNIADAVNSGILERKFIPRHPDKLAFDLGRYLEPLKARPASKTNSGFSIELNDGGKAAIIKKCMARH